MQARRSDPQPIRAPEKPTLKKRSVETATEESASAWTRTRDQLIKSQLLYQLSYRGVLAGDGNVPKDSCLSTLVLPDDPAALAFDARDSFAARIANDLPPGPIRSNSYP